MDEIASLMAAHRVKRLPVLRDGRLVGIVRRADLLRTIGGGEYEPVPLPPEPRPGPAAWIDQLDGAKRPEPEAPHRAPPELRHDEELTVGDFRHLVNHHKEELDHERARQRADSRRTPPARPQAPDRHAHLRQGMERADPWRPGSGRARRNGVSAAALSEPALQRRRQGGQRARSGLADDAPRRSRGNVPALGTRASSRGAFTSPRASWTFPTDCPATSGCSWCGGNSSPRASSTRRLRSLGPRRSTVGRQRNEGRIKMATAEFRITRLALHGRHGVLEAERSLGQHFFLDLDIDRRHRQRAHLRPGRRHAPLRSGHQGRHRRLQRTAIQPDRGGRGCGRRRSPGAASRDRQRRRHRPQAVGAGRRLHRRPRRRGRCGTVTIDGAP